MVSGSWPSRSMERRQASSDNSMWAASVCVVVVSCQPVFCMPVHQQQRQQDDSRLVLTSSTGLPHIAQAQCGEPAATPFMVMISVSEMAAL